MPCQHPGDQRACSIACQMACDSGVAIAGHWPVIYAPARFIFEPWTEREDARWAPAAEPEPPRPIA